MRAGCRLQSNTTSEYPSLHSDVNDNFSLKGIWQMSNVKVFLRTDARAMAKGLKSPPNTSKLRNLRLNRQKGLVVPICKDWCDVKTAPSWSSVETATRWWSTDETCISPPLLCENGIECRSASANSTLSVCCTPQSLSSPSWPSSAWGTGMAPDLAATELGRLGPHFPGPHLLSAAGPSGPSARSSASQPSSVRLSTSSYSMRLVDAAWVLNCSNNWWHSPVFPQNPLLTHP